MPPLHVKFFRLQSWSTSCNEPRKLTGRTFKTLSRNLMSSLQPIEAPVCHRRIGIERSHRVDNRWMKSTSGAELPLSSQKRLAKQTTLSPGDHAKKSGLPDGYTLHVIRKLASHARSTSNSLTSASRTNPIPNACPGLYGAACCSMSQRAWRSSSEVEFEDVANMSSNDVCFSLGKKNAQRGLAGLASVDTPGSFEQLLCYRIERWENWARCTMHALCTAL